MINFHVSEGMNCTLLCLDGTYVICHFCGLTQNGNSWIRCNGLEVAAKRPTERHIYPTKATVEPIIEGQTDEVNGSNERKQREEEKSGAHSLSEKETEISKEVVAPSTAPNSKLSPIHRRPKDAVLSKKKESVLHEPNVSGCSHGPQDCRSQSQGMGKDFDSTKRHFFTLDEFREDVKISCASAHGPIVIVSYSRKGLLQTGDGHFSPIAGYNEAKDMCLIMDVARFKYPPHWVSTTVLYHAMCRLDPVCNQTRGWMVCSNAERSESYYFKLNTTSIERQQVETLKDALCCCSSRFVSELVGSAVHSDCDHDHGKMDAVQVIRCLLECLPTPLDQYLISQTEKFGLTLDETHKVIKSKLMKGIRECGVHDVVCKLFEEESNADLRKRFEKCLKQKEVITLMVLVMGNDNVWAKLSDQRVAKQLKAWCAINKEKCPELDHEVKSLQYQIRNLNHFLASMYSEAYTAPTFCHH